MDKEVVLLIRKPKNASSLWNVNDRVVRRVLCGINPPEHIIGTSSYVTFVCKKFNAIESYNLTKFERLSLVGYCGVRDNRFHIFKIKV